MVVVVVVVVVVAVVVVVEVVVVVVVCVCVRHFREQVPRGHLSHFRTGRDPHARNLFGIRS